MKKRNNIKDVMVNICCIDNDSYREELEGVVKKLNMKICPEINSCNLMLVGEKYGVNDFMKECISVAKHLDKPIVRYNIPLEEVI